MYQPLIAPLPAFARKALEKFPGVLGEVLPFSHGHKLKLPQAISDLSGILTSQRKFLAQPYWQEPRFVSAYMRYFLPWNIIRLSRLFSGLELGDLPSSAQLVDLGSGPLTVPLALWLSLPQWRKLELRILCADASPHIMKLGLEFFKALAAQVGEPLKWSFCLTRDSWLKALRSSGSATVVTAGNMLNEVNFRGSDSPFAELAHTLHTRLRPDGFALFVEPGTRLGGILISKLRQAALTQGLASVAPCSHTGTCPLYGNTKRGWCHVSFEAEGPEWLIKLTRLANLQKSSLSLSFQLFRHNSDAAIAAPLAKGSAASFKGRIVSDVFYIPREGYARYVCGPYGLGIIRDDRRIPFGSAVNCSRSKGGKRDARSGAIWLEVTD